MNSVTTFQSTKEPLLNLLQSIGEGKTQLPDFQRGWVWDDDHIRSLLASVSLSYPIGAVMMLETGNERVRFKPRLIEGVSLERPPQPEQLILDGQQRLTSLFQALYSGEPVETRDARGKPILRRYYLDIHKVLSPQGEREEAIIGLPEDRLLRNFRGEVIADYSTTERECAAELLPLPLVYNTAGIMAWQMQYLQADPQRYLDRMACWTHLLQTVIQPFQQYQVPVILLSKETPKEAVCQVFEKVNTGGVALTVFELLTATFAADNYNLREDWISREKRLQKQKALLSLENTDFLQTVALLTTYTNKLRNADAAVSCKRKDILRLTLDEYQRWAEPATQGFEKAAKLLYAQNVLSARDLPYRTQLTPLAAILTVLGDRADNDGVRAKLIRWYWCGVFGELYGSSLETQFAKDVPEVLSWIDGGSAPSTVENANFTPSRLLTLQTRNSAAYKGLFALLLRDGCLDFRSGIPIDVTMYFDDKIDIHHIFPQDWCKRNGIEAKYCDSIVNKTALSAKTNRMIGGNSPKVYLTRIQKHAGIDDSRMDRILYSHVINSSYLRADDFFAFFKAREAALLMRIERAMGKPIARDMLQEDARVYANGINEYQALEEAEV